MSEDEEPLGAEKSFFAEDFCFLLEDSTSIEYLNVTNSAFDNTLNVGEGRWHYANMTFERDGAFEGESSLFSGLGKPWRLNSQHIPVVEKLPHLLTIWVRSNQPASLRLSFPDGGGHIWADIPATGGSWREYGLFFRSVDRATHVHLHISSDRNVPVDAYFALDSLKLRTATEGEYQKAFDRWRLQYPDRDLVPRPTDGAHLALSIRKLESGFRPDRPFLVWAIGSSYTNMLGMGDVLRQTILQRFPGAPEVIYRKHVGSAVTYDYLLGWYRHQVISEQPDLILIYCLGSPDALDLLLSEIRRTSTADIIVPSIHWRMGDAHLWGKSENAREQDVDALRAVCAKYDVEFVNNRAEWAEYMLANEIPLEIYPNGLLKDRVHQSNHGALVINENIARHVAKPKSFSYDPESRERFKLVEDEAADQPLIVKFNGNRIDLIGRHTGPLGGTLLVEINGQPATESDAYFMSFIQPGDSNKTPERRGMVGDYAPHGIELGGNVVPQSWTITMLDDEGNYELVGSITGADGFANNREDFISDSGQIIIPTNLWRHSIYKGEFSNRAGDTFNFDVTSAAVDSVSFTGESGQLFRKTLVANLPNGSHELRLYREDSKPVSVVSLQIFDPMLKAN